jgi:hypothetical protein
MSSGVGKYRLGPFVFASDLLLPELTPLQPAAVANAFIRYAAVPDRIQGVVANETQWWASPHEYLQRIPGIANFLARDGRESLVEPAPRASPEDIGSATEQLGISPAGLPRVLSSDDKYRLKVCEIDDRLPLCAFFFLEWAAPGAPTTFTESHRSPRRCQTDGIHHLSPPHEAHVVDALEEHFAVATR